MLNELKELEQRLQGCRGDLYKLYSRLDPIKNSKSKEEILSAQLDVMQAITKLTRILVKAESIQKGGANQDAISSE
jgi:hypothetical protein